MINFREIVYNNFISNSKKTILVADLGGTHANFGILNFKDNNLTLMISLHADSQEITNITEVIQQVLNFIKIKYNLTFTEACFGAAGMVINNQVKLSNAPFVVNIDELKDKTSLQDILLINDFEAVGYGINAIDQEHIIPVKEGAHIKKTRKLCFGAGTGLGKTILKWDNHLNDYITMASEGGHTDFPAQNKNELALTEFIKQNFSDRCVATWEDILSGRGIENLYKFLINSNLHQITNVDNEIQAKGFNPADVFKHKNSSQLCQEAFNLFSTFYARAARIFAIDSLAYDGIYIAGGIASKNLDIFSSKSFKEEFNVCGKMQEFIKNVPIYVVQDYNVSLYGAAVYLLQNF